MKLGDKEKHGTEISNVRIGGKEETESTGHRTGFFELPDKGFLKCCSTPLIPLAFNNSLLLISALLK